VRELYDAQRKSVARFLRYLGVPSAELDDAVQEVFIVIARRVREVAPLAFEPWAREIARRIALAMARERARRPAVPELECEAVETPSVEARLAQRNVLLRLLAQLTQDQREVFVLYEIEEMSMREVAQLLRCPVQTAYSRYCVASERLEDAAKRLGITGVDR
jgi:RNA polymerase sigma-70 factor (ECF subfamily)